MKKTFVLDTNVLLHDPEALTAFEDNNVVIPIYVIEEVDAFKKDQSELGRNARHAVRNLDALRAFVVHNEYDSTAIIADLAISGKGNLGTLLGGAAKAELRTLTQMVLKWTRTACTAEHPLPASECPLIDGLIANLVAFREHGPDIDASNVWHFDLSALVKGFDHLVVAHNFLNVGVKLI